MKIIVTGGAGFIGSHITEDLLDQGHEVLVLDNLSTGKESNVPHGATLLTVDIRDADAVDRAFTDFSPDGVSHQAAQTSVSVSTRKPLLDADVNVLGSLNVLEAAKKHDVERFVFASTGGAIYGEVPDGERAETSWPTLPISPYACSKLAFEGYLRAAHMTTDLSCQVLRYANVYGPRQDPHGEAGVVAIFCQRLVAGQGIAVFAKQKEGDRGCVRDYVMVKDVVSAHRVAIRGEALPFLVNVCTGEAADTQDLAEVLIRELGADTSALRFGPIRAGDLERSVLAPSPELTQLLSAPVSLESGLTTTAAWFKENT